ncbi:MAG: DUF3857 domain-containing protein [Myxococcales bacterium]|nr:DUF3857 domain-containing protein [Myxococcales bacterium]MCB9645467.1 DUF3857 domain-containing protein [Deltaproteobacteria bacterium]
MRARWLAATALAVNLGCSSSLPRPEFERFAMDATPVATLYPDAPAVVVLDRGELLLTVDTRTGNPLARLRRVRRVKVLREAGLAQAEVKVAYEPGTAIHGLQARAVLPDGDEVVADEENIADSPLAGEVRAKTLFVPGVTVGAVVETIYDQYVQDPRFLAPWVFQGELPTARSELAVIVPEGYQVDLRFSEEGAFVERPAERFETDLGTRFSWSLKDLPPRYPEPGMPDASLLAPRAHVIFLGARIGRRDYDGFRTWDDVAAWFVARMPHWAELKPETIAEARRVAGEAPELERALKIMEVLAKDLPEEPGPVPPLWRAPLPHPDGVLAKKSANPTSRGLLFVALLRAAGLDAVPGLFVYRDEDVILPDLPTVRALDGVCAVLPRPEGTVVLDPSQPLVSTQVAAPRLQGTRLVALMRDGAQVIRVPESDPADSLAEIRFDLTLDERGDVFGPLKATLTGAEAGVLRAELLRAPPESYSERVTAFLRTRGVPFDVESVSIADLTALRRPLGISASVNARGFLEGSDPDVNVALARLVGAHIKIPAEVRRAELVLGAPAQVELRATLTLPEEFEVQGLPEPTTASWAGGQVSLTARSETRRRLGFVRTETRTWMSVPVAQYKAFRRYREAVQVAEDQSFLIRRPPPRTLEY